MLRYSIVFLVIALVAAFFGLGSVAAGASGIAQTLFFIFLIFAMVSLTVGLVRGRG